jgi:hypothetical protein
MLSAVMLSVIIMLNDAECHYAEYHHYAECHYAECHHHYAECHDYAE